MKELIFDFDNIETIEDFYSEAATAFSFPEHFGNNLDALWDMLTSEIELPMHVQFQHLTLEQLDEFAPLISLFEEAEDELGDDFIFTYFIRNE